MKRILLMALLALTLTLPAFAHHVIFVDFANNGGKLTGSSAGLTLTGSELTGIGTNGGGLIQGELGTLTFTTGALTSGNLTTGATFSSVGSSFVITGNGTNGIPNGVIFNGAFTGSIVWIEGTCVNVGICYTLVGSVSGTYFDGSGWTIGSGVTAQITLFTGSLGFMGEVTLGSGTTVIPTLPEPGTLVLFGTGLVGVAGVVRRKKLFAGK